MNTTTKKHTMKEAVQAEKPLFQLPKVGDIVTGIIIGKEGGVLYVNLGPVGTGVIYGVEYFKAQDTIKNLEAGDTVVAKLVELENEDGYRELSLKEAQEEKSWRSLEEKYSDREVIKVKITDANKGGLMAKVDGMVGFVPVSQLAPQHYPRVEGGDKSKILDELKGFIGETMDVRILDLNPTEDKLIFSEREAEKASIEKSLEKYAVGDTVEGEITGVVEFGAFIKFDPLLEGLIHISELDWSLIENPRDIVDVGDKVKAKIVDIADDGRVSLSLKALKENPWQDIEKRYKTGDTLKQEVSKIQSYGALVKLEEGIQGLVHVSEFGSEEALRDALKEGEEYEFEIANVDPEEHKISLRLKGSEQPKESKKEEKTEATEQKTEEDNSEKE